MHRSWPWARSPSRAKWASAARTSRTAGETSNLEKKESAVNQEVRTDRELNDGHLTGQEKRTVNQQQSNLSRQIFLDKHS